MADTEMDTIEVLEPPLITVEVLINGGASQIIALPSKYRFTSAVARDAYFAANPDELVTQMYVLVGETLYEYLGNQWISLVNVVTGPAGQPFKVVKDIDSVDELPDPSYAPSNEAYLVKNFEDGNHLYVLVDGQWSDQGAMSGVPGPTGPTGPQGPKGDTGPRGETPKFRLTHEGHLIAIYEQEV